MPFSTLSSEWLYPPNRDMYCLGGYGKRTSLCKLICDELKASFPKEPETDLPFKMSHVANLGHAGRSWKVWAGLGYVLMIGAPVVVEMRHYCEMRVDKWPLHYKGNGLYGQLDQNLTIHHTVKWSIYSKSPLQIRKKWTLTCSLESVVIVWTVVPTYQLYVLF